MNEPGLPGIYHEARSQVFLNSMNVNLPKKVLNNQVLGKITLMTRSFKLYFIFVADTFDIMKILT